MRILCVTPWFPARPGEQAGNFILDSVEALAALGHRVSVLVIEPWRPRLAGLLRSDWRSRPIDIQSFGDAFRLRVVRYVSVPRNVARPLSNALHDAWIGRTLRRFIAAERPDVLHCHTESVAPVMTRIGKEFHLPTVVTLHGINTAKRLLAPAQMSYIGRGLAAADRVVLVGEPLRAHFEPTSGRSDNFRIVHNGFRPPGIAASATPTTARMNRLISVSNLHEGKGIDLTLRALARLLEEDVSDWTYTVVGSGSGRSALQALAVDLSLTAHVTFVGAWPHSRIYEQLSRADIFVLPSYREAFGIAYLEAMAAGLLAIGVSGQGPEAFITSGKTGYLVHPRDVGELADCLRKVISEPARSREIAAAGQTHVREKFTWKRHAEQLAGVFAEVAGT